MSEINEIIGKSEERLTLDDRQKHLDNLRALNVIADALESIAEALEVRNLHDGITTEPFVAVMKTTP